jgi:D-alanyl-D-alanine carboxypeptidase/D-alanyl-D-alanine-endopeptidase (penicillin-binding protein 4)
MTSAELKEKIPYQSLQMLAQNVSPPLGEIVTVMNKKSNNFYAEQIFRTLAKEAGGEGSWKAGAKVVQNYISSLGISVENFSIRDGSGLSRMNLVTPEGMVQLLRALHRDAKLHKSFTESLPIMGKDGTLQERLKNTPAEGNVIAKTGLLSGERSLSGYLTTKDNETLVFSILVNNYTCPVKDINNIQDLIMLRLVNFSRK